MSASNRGGKSGRDKTAKSTHSLQNGKVDTTVAGIKNQPTAEQLRIARITSDKTEVEPEVVKKVKQVCELTGRTTDEALTVLHDCDYDTNQAVELLLEKQGDEVNNWQEISKKKKAPVGGKSTQASTNAGTPADSANDVVIDRNDILIETDRTQERSFDNAPRGRRERGGGPPRFNRGRGGSSANGEKGGSVSRERPPFEQSGGRGGRRRGGFANSGGVGRGGGGGGNYGRGFYGGRNNFDTGSPHIDTWSNEKTPNGNTTVANSEPEWGTEDWTADEWSGSLEESRVFTASAAPGSGHKSTVFGSESTSSAIAPSSSVSSSSFYDPSTLSTQVFVASSVSSSSSALRAPGSGTTSDSVGQSLLGEAATYRSNTLQSGTISQEALSTGTYDLNLLLQQSKLNEQYSLSNQQPKLSDSYSQEQSAAYLSRYTQEATEVIKNAVGIGSTNITGRSAVAMDPIGHNLTTSQSGMQNCISASVAKQPPQQQRPKLPPPSKIPSSAVEMPASMNSAQLDVQFGNWDIPSVAASSEASALSFTADLGASGHYGSGQHSMSHVPGGSLHGGSSLAASYDMSVLTSNAMTESSKSSMLSLEDLGLGTASKQPVQTAVSAGSYQGSSNVAKDFGNSKMVPNQQSNSVGYPPSQGAERKSSPYAASASNAHTSIPSQLPFSQVSSSYAVGIESSSSIPSMYNKSSAAATSTSPTPVFSSQQHAINQYGSASSFSTYQNSVSDAGLAAAVAAAQQQYSYTGAAAPGFGQQPVMGGSAYGPSQNQTAAYAAGTGLHGAVNKSYNSASLAMTDKQPTAGSTSATYSAGSISSQAYNDANNSYQFGSGQMPSGSGYQLSGQYQNSGYQGVSYNQASVAPGYESTSGSTGYGSTAYQSNMYPRQVRESATSSGNYQSVPDSTSAAAGYQRSLNSVNQTGNGGVVQQATTTAASAQSAPTQASGKLTDNLGKLSVKDGQGVSSSVSGTAQFDSVGTNSSLSTATGTTSSAGLLASTPSNTATSRTTSTAATGTKSSTPATSKAVVNMPAVGGPAVMNNYMIAQPPGFQLAAFGYPTPQQPMQYTYEDLQLLQSGQRFPIPYYDMPPFQPATTMTGRDTSATLNVQSYAAGVDTSKLTPIDPMSPVAVQPSPAPAQQASVPGSAAAVAVQQQQQQSYLNPAAMHPAAAAGYNLSGYYYPGTAGIMSVGSYYTPMIQMGGVAVPLATNPATATTQYQKAANAAMYGSHAGYTVGGQNQDFSKSFGATQSVSKGPAVAAGAGTAAASSDVLAGGSAFGKNHVQQNYDKSGFHSGTPPPPFNMAAAQTGAAIGGGYGAQYMPTMMPHQSHSTQILHHPMSQDASIAGRGAVPQNQAQQPKPGSMNKATGYSTAYWGAN